jgi:hypothetical protein
MKTPAPCSLLQRRALLKAGASGLGGLALNSLLSRGSARAAAPDAVSSPARAKRAVWLFMAGGPSQLDLFDYKPTLAARANQLLPDSVRGNLRLSTMTSTLPELRIAPAAFEFRQHGRSGAWLSELLPHTAEVVDDLTVIKTVQSDVVNHDPGVLAMLTGSQVAGKPAVGAWLSYGLGSLNQNLPTFVVMTSAFSQHAGMVQALSSRLWDSAFLPEAHAGVPVRSGGEPVLFLKDPPGLEQSMRRHMLDAGKSLNQHRFEQLHDPEIQTRVEQHEMAFRMQSAVPELTDLSGETDASKALYGPEVNTPGSFAHNCLMARRMLERDVRFVQIFHRGWDAHEFLPAGHRLQCADIDQACRGLITDLKRRGLLQDTLVIWGGEFGRTVFYQGEPGDEFGRDHHGNCFSMWMAGAGIKPGMVHGETDDFGFNVVNGAVPLRDLHATILDQFGLDHEQLAVPFQGLSQKLVGVGPRARVVSEILG